MTRRTVAIALKIPDNAAFTARQALARLGIQLERVERSDVWRCEDAGEADTFARRIAANESMYNPNKHRLTVLSDEHPRPGEVWVGRRFANDDDRSSKPIPGVGAVRRFVAWRLYEREGTPARRTVVEDAVRVLLCNPAIDEARYER